MTIPDLQITTELTTTEAVDAVAYLVSSTNGIVRPEGRAAALDGVTEMLASIGATGSLNEVVRLPATGTRPTLAFVGIGAKPLTAENLRIAAGQVTRLLAGVAVLAIDFPHADQSEARALIEGAAMGGYEFTGYRGPSQHRKAPVGRVIVISAVAEPATLTRGIVGARAVALVRDLANTPALDLYPASFVERASTLAGALPVAVTVWDEVQLEAEGFGGILGVGSGSLRPPRLMKLAYRPDGTAKHLALVGKGITFDTGGLSLKPPVPMVGMKYDMTGAATALAVVLAAAELELPVAVTAWLALAENMPSGTAIRPGDVLTIRGGKTVEVLNTDAEGRLVMADALVAASAERPDAIIDIATLTGAAKVALGDRYVAVMGGPEFVQEVIGSAERAGESFWPMPLPEEMRAWLNSEIADISNVKTGNTAGGALLAGIFLNEFVGRISDDPAAAQIPWAHLDIAGTAWGDTATGYLTKGPTGVAVRALLDFTESFGPA